MNKRSQTCVGMLMAGAALFSATNVGFTHPHGHSDATVVIDISDSDSDFGGLANLSVGLRGGLSLSQHQGTEPREFEYTVGSEMRREFTAGVLLTLPITERFGIQQEVNYVRKGSRQEIGVEVFEVPTVLDVSYDMDYIEIPVFLRYNWWLGDRFDVYSLGGFGFALKVDDQYELSGLVDDGSQTIPLRAKDDMSEVDLFDFFFAYGVGTEIPWLGPSWIVEYRFDLSLQQLPLPTYAYVPFGEDEILVENEPVPLRNQSHLISFGVRF